MRDGDDSDAGSTEPSGFFILGVGASAGGLEALGDLFASIHSDGMAFVIVQHLVPDHESLLAELLSRSSKIRVTTAAGEVKVEPNHAYVIPPNTDDRSGSSGSVPRCRAITGRCLAGDQAAVSDMNEIIIWH